jgi:hypothetical protein
MMLPFDTYIENDEVPFDEGTEFGIFLNGIFDALKVMRELDVDPRLRAGMNIRWNAIKQRAEKANQ